MTKNNFLNACKKWENQFVSDYLWQGWDINLLTNDGINWIIIAAYRWNINLCRVLIDDWINVNQVSKTGLSALGASITIWRLDIVKLLVSSGANQDLLSEEEKNLWAIIDPAKSQNDEVNENLSVQEMWYRANMNDQIASYQKRAKSELEEVLHIKYDFRLELQDIENPKFLTFEEESQSTSSIIQNQFLTRNSVLFLDTEVHDLDSPIVIQLAYKYWENLNSKEFNKYYSTGGVLISHWAMGVHHITEKMLEWKEVFEKSEDKEALNAILQEKILVAHNAKFDIWVLWSVWIKIPNSICTLKVAHYLFPDLENYKLQTLRYKFNLELDWDINPHDAMSDILVLEKLFWKFYKEMSDRLGTIDSKEILDNMKNISSKPILLDTVTFWKHKWEKWNSVPKDYLDWILKKSDLRNDEDIAYTCKHYLIWRGGTTSDNMFEKAWKHPRRNNTPAIEEDSTKELDTNPDNQSGTKVFGIFLILIVVMVLISVLF